MRSFKEEATASIYESFEPIALIKWIIMNEIDEWEYMSINNDHMYQKPY